MSNKLIVLITGANQGIGYHAATQLAATGKYHVLVGSRSLSKGQEAVKSILANDKKLSVKGDDLEALQIDVTDDASIEQAAESVKEKYGRLDILVNNAGISVHPSPNATLREQYQAIYNANLFGSAVTTTTFLSLLRASTLSGGKRIIFVSTGLSSLHEATKPGSQYPANQYSLYRSSKTGLNMAVAGFHADLEPEGFVIGAVCPGYCGTNLNGYSGFKDPFEGAKIILDAVEGKKEDVEMRVIHNDGEGGKRGAHPW